MCKYSAPVVLPQLTANRWGGPRQWLSTASCLHRSHCKPQDQINLSKQRDDAARPLSGLWTWDKCIQGMRKIPQALRASATPLSASNLKPLSCQERAFLFIIRRGWHIPQMIQVAGDLRITSRGAEDSSPGTLQEIMEVSSSLQFLMINFLFLPSTTIWILNEKSVYLSFQRRDIQVIYDLRAV